MSDQKTWFYEQDGNQLGPVSDSTITGMIASGILNPKSVVWREGMSDWLPFEKCDLALTPDQPPLLPGNQPTVFTPREAKLNSNFNFGIREALGAGWTTMVADFWPFVGFYALASIILSVASQLILPIFFLTYPAMGGFMYYTVKRLRGQTADIEDIFEGYKRRFGTTALLSFILTIPFLLGMLPVIGTFVYFAQKPEAIESNPFATLGLVGGGVILTLIILAILGTITGLATLLSLDCDIGCGKAFRLASKAFGKHPVKLVIFSIITMILAYVGVFAFFVGSFVTGAWGITAYSYIYEKAFGDEVKSLG